MQTMTIKNKKDNETYTKDFNSVDEAKNWVVNHLDLSKDWKIDQEKKMTQYKYEEIKSHFDEWIKEQDQEWIKENIDDLHHHCFNTDYYIIGTYQAKQWLNDNVFEIIEIIKEYEQNNFGEVNSDFSSPEHVVNMYTYIIGEEIVNDYINKLEKKEVA